MTIEKDHTTIIEEDMLTWVDVVAVVVVMTVVAV